MVASLGVNLKFTNIGIYYRIPIMENYNNRNLTDEQIRAIIIKRKRKQRMRKRVIRRCSVLALALVLVIGGIVMLVRGCSSGSDAHDGRESAAETVSFADKDEPGIIFLDPGHGGVDSGTDAGGRFEKDDSLKLAKAVSGELKQMGYEVYMSRTEDVDVDREDRGLMANAKSADLFISFHRNQASEGNGAEIYIPSDSTDKEKTLAEKLMAAFVECGFEERSITAGVFKDPTDDYYENSVPTMPSCLAEVGFTSNDGDNEIYDRVDKNAKIIAKAISEAHKEIYPEKYSA